jgi:hypothetical protein
MYCTKNVILLDESYWFIEFGLNLYYFLNSMVHIYLIY